MKTLWIKLFSIVLFSTLLSGCMTGLLLEDSSAKMRRTETKIVTKKKEIDADKVVALGQDKQTQNVMIIGEKYWIALDAPSSKQIQQLVEGKFSQPFFVKKAIEVETRSDSRINTTFTLQYKAENNTEKEKIQHLGFECASLACNNTYKLNGTIYLNNPAVNQAMLPLPSKVSNYPLPLKIIEVTRQAETEYVGRAGTLLKTITMLPLALAADVIIVPTLFILSH